MRISHSEAKNRIGIRTPIVYGPGLFVFFILLRIFFAGTFAHFFTSLVTPLWSIRDTVVGIAPHLPLYAQSKETLVNKNTELENELYTLQVKNAELRSQVLSSTLQQHNLSFLPGNTIVAKVISKPPFSPFDSVTIDSGQSKPIILGKPVYAHDSLLIGEISEIFGNNARVTLYSSGGMTHPANILRTGQGIRMIGAGGGNFVVSVPKDFNIVSGDMIVDMLPQEHLMAEVYYVENTTDTSFKKVYARSPINMFQLNWVSVEE